MAKEAPTRERMEEPEARSEEKHTSNILAKMGAGSRTEATARALREGLLD